MNAKPLRIDVWSDLVCPWCWIGKHRLQAALAGTGMEVEVHWHPFLLDPDTGSEPVPLRQAYERKFGGPERVEHILANTQTTANAEGLPMDFDRGQVRVGTLDAHRLLWLAAREGKVDAVGEALFHAHFAEGRNLADPQVLADAGASGGLARERVLAMLASDEGRAEVQAELAQAQAMGIRAVPTFVLDGRLALQGAQPPDMFRQAFTRLGHAPIAGAQDAAACGREGCTP